MQQLEFHLRTEYIELHQLLKVMDFTTSGGDARLYLEMHTVSINGENETRRGRKIRAGDVVILDKDVQISVH